MSLYFEDRSEGVCSILHDAANQGVTCTRDTHQHTAIIGPKTPWQVGNWCEGCGIGFRQDQSVAPFNLGASDPILGSIRGFRFVANVVKR